VPQFSQVTWDPINLRTKIISQSLAPDPSLTLPAPTFTCEVQYGVVFPSVIRNHCPVSSLVLFGQLERRMRDSSVWHGFQKERWGAGQEPWAPACS
jgi:hypothetical protein